MAGENTFRRYQGDPNETANKGFQIDTEEPQLDVTQPLEIIDDDHEIVDSVLSSDARNDNQESVMIDQEYEVAAALHPAMEPVKLFVAEIGVRPNREVSMEDVATLYKLAKLLHKKYDNLTESIKDEIQVLLTECSEKIEVLPSDYFQDEQKDSLVGELQQQIDYMEELISDEFDDEEVSQAA